MVNLKITEFKINILMPIAVSQLTMLMLLLILVAFPTLLFNQVFLFYNCYSFCDYTKMGELYF